MTIDQVKQDIKEGKVNAIYYSSQTLWWTHLDEDVSSATESGKRVSEIRFQKFMSNPSIPKEEKERMESLRKTIGDYNPPTDPSGSPLFMFTEKSKIEEWISKAEENPSHFGKYQLAAFIKTHHQNCNDMTFKRWEDVNYQIEKEELW